MTTATNIATQKLLDRAPSTAPITKIDVNIFACAQADIQAIRQALGDNKQILRFLDRDMRASQVRMNDGGDVCWVIHKPGVTPKALFANAFAILEDCALPEADAALGPVQIKNRGRVTNLAAYTDYGFQYATVAISANVWENEILSGTTWLSLASQQFRVDQPYVAKAKSKRFANVGLGQRHSITFEGLAAGDWLPADQPDPYFLGDSANRWSKKSPSDLTIGAKLVPQAPTALSLLTDLVVLAGPACVDHAEFYPGGFAVIVAGMETLSDGMRSVAITADPKGVTTSKLMSALTDMSVNKEAYMVAFRGSSDVPPISLIPAAYDMVKRSGAVFDPTTIGGRSLEAILANWSSDRWSFAAAGPSVKSDLMERTLKGSGPVSIKASGDSSVHVDDGAGTADMSFSTALPLIRAVRRSGRSVVFIDSPWTTKGTFDASGYAVLVDASSGSGEEAPVVPGLEGSIMAMGEAVAAATIMKPVYNQEEGYLISALMTPEYFWTKINT